MKKKIIVALIVAAIATAAITTKEAQDVTVNENSIPSVEDITGWEATDSGILLTFEDGTGYYIEK